MLTKGRPKLEFKYLRMSKSTTEYLPLVNLEYLLLIPKSNYNILNIGFVTGNETVGALEGIQIL